MIIVPDGWLKKRRHTLYAFVVQYFLFSIEWTAFILIKLPYLKTIISDDNDVKLFYGLISVSYLVFSIFAAPAVAKFVDKTRRVKEALILSNLTIVLGNVIFGIPQSPYYLLFGRLIAGIGISSTSIVVSEIARSYGRDEVSKKISIAMSGYMLGFLLGPCIGSIFTEVNYEIANDFVISYGNSVSFFLAFCFLVFIFVMSFTVHNLSLEYDLKAALAREERNNFYSDIETFKEGFLIREKSTVDEKPDDSASNIKSINIFKPEQLSLKENKLLEEKNVRKCTDEYHLTYRQVFTNPALILMYSLSTLYQTNIVAYDIWVPLLVTNTLKWESLYTNTIFLIIAVLTFIILSLTSRFKMSSNIAFLLLALSLTFLVDTISILQIIKSYPLVISLTVPFFCIFVIMYSITSVVYMVIIIPLINNMVPSEYQTFAESLRYSTVRVGSSFTLMLAPYIFDGLYVCAIVMMIVNFIHLYFVIKFRHIIRAKF